MPSVVLIVDVGRDARAAGQLEGQHGELALGLGAGADDGGQATREQMTRPLAGPQEVGRRAAGQGVVRGVGAWLGVGLLGQVLHVEVVLGLPELGERDDGLEADRKRGAAGVWDADQVEEAIPAAGDDRADEPCVVAEQAVGVHRAGGRVAEVAGVQDPALAVEPQLDRAAVAEEELVFLIVEVQRDRPAHRAVERHHRERAAGLLGAGLAAADLVDEQVGPAPAGRHHVGDGATRQLRRRRGAGHIGHLFSLGGVIYTGGPSVISTSSNRLPSGSARKDIAPVAGGGAGRGAHTSRAPAASSRSWVPATSVTARAQWP